MARKQAQFGNAALSKFACLQIARGDVGVIGANVHPPESGVEPAKPERRAAEVIEDSRNGPAPDHSFDHAGRDAKT